MCIRDRSQAGPAPWWNKRCRSTLTYKDQVFLRCREGVLPLWKYKVAVKYARAAQKKAYAVYQRKLRGRLKHSNGSSKEFWELVKEISGLEQSRNSSAPSTESLVGHFQNKMSNAKGEEDNNPPLPDGFSCLLYTSPSPRDRTRSRMPSSA
eukprot:TRINITY_DN19249_c0_g1_i1.p1 TRINITY_DN19249_c0_g1~~TRINITY_DN19249_c0_g1_i1.p1  ORF type:complete len:151 (-),score=46.64 TRINITY_DN19249_c0_g1_i1:105-557(-)